MALRAVVVEPIGQGAARGAKVFAVAFDLIKPDAIRAGIVFLLGAADDKNRSFSAAVRVENTVGQRDDARTW